MPVTLPQLELNRAAFSAGAGPCEVPYGGEYDNTWAAPIIVDIVTIDKTLDLDDGQILIGRTGQANQKAVLSGDVTMNNAGVVTIGNNAVTTAKINNSAVTPAKLTYEAKIQFAQARAILDLSGAAQTDVVVAFLPFDATLGYLYAVYAEGSSADAGVTIKVGKASPGGVDDDYYYTGASEVSIAQWSQRDLALLQTDIPAGTTITCACVGSKVGAGEILIVAEFYVNNP